jgi:hypothetical protein
MSFSLMQAAKADPHAIGTSEATAVGPIDEELKKRLLPYLVDLCDWILTLQVGSGKLENLTDKTVTGHGIFVNGNFVRGLLAAHKITGKASYLEEGLRWCDTFLGQQQLVPTSSGEEAGYWTDRYCGGPRARNIYLADAGTAATAFALGYLHAEPPRRERYLKAMERFALFVSQGCARDPQDLGRGGSPGWVIASGKDRGALGCGYYRGHLSTAPYVISTATNGAAFHSLLHSITKDPRYAEIAKGAVRWLLSQRLDDGRIPYIIDNLPPRHNNLYGTMAYCTEGFIATHMYVDDDQLREKTAAELRPTIEWLIKTQNPDGTWGKLGTPQIERSPNVVTLMAWYYRAVDPDERIAQAVRKYCEFLLEPKNSKKYGIKHLVRVSGFVGMVVADLIQPGATFS